jgi:hypothetical protein
LGIDSDSWDAARSAAAEISSCSLAVRASAVERAVVQPATKAADSKTAERGMILRMGHSLNQPLPAATLFILQIIAMPAAGIMTFHKENRPNRITDGTCFALVSDIRPDCFDMGSRPLFSFALWRRPGVLTRTLASRFQAKPGLLSGGVSCMQEPPVTGFNPPGFKKGLALPSGANKSGLHRIDHDAVRCVRIMTSRIWAP